MEPGKKLYRSTKDRVIAGVCGGVASYFKADPALVRLIFAVSILFGSLGFWVYVVMWLVVPEEPAAVPPAGPPPPPPPPTTP